MARFWGNGKFPYTQLNNLNLDWLIKCVQQLSTQIVEAVRGDVVQNKSAAWKEQARQNIDAVGTSDVIDIEHGGTGATSVVGALTALGSAGLLYYGMTSTTLTLRFSAAVRFLIIVTNNNTAQQCAAIVFCGRNATPGITPLGTLASTISLTGDVSSLTVTLSNANSTTGVTVLCLTQASYNRITLA